MLDQSVLANLVLPSLSHHKNKAGIVDSKWETEVTKEYINKISIKTPGVSSIIRNLSGGNQQKVILSRWLAANSKKHTAEYVYIRATSLNLHSGTEIQKLQHKRYDTYRRNGKQYNS